MEKQNSTVSLQKSEDIMPTPVVQASAVPTPAAQTSAVQTSPVQTSLAGNTKFCKFCGGQIPMDAILCTVCGRQVEQLQGGNAPQPSQIVINNSSSANATATTVVGAPAGKKKSKWVCFFLWLFLGLVGGHKFYEGRIGTGILYIFTLGGFLIGWFIDFFRILNKPNPYYV